MNKNNLNFDVNTVMDTFFDDENNNDDTIEVTMKNDIEKLFTYIDCKNQFD